MNVAMIGLRAPGVEGGVEQVVHHLGPKLVQRGCAVTVFCRTRYNPHGSSLNGMRLVNLPSVNTKRLEALTHTALAVGAASLHDFDLVHIHAAGPAALSFVPRLANQRTVVTLHAPDWKRAKWGPGARMALRFGALVGERAADAVIVVSEEMVRHVRGARRVTRIPNGVEALGPAPLASAEVPGLQPGFLLYLGRLVPEKRVDTLLRAHAASGTQRQLVITGSPGHSTSYYSRLRKLAGPGVLFTGSRFGLAKRALLSNAAAALFPSEVEGLPVSLLEALAAGCPPLASDIPAHRQVICQPFLGVLLPPKVAAWSAALARPERVTSTFDPQEARRHVQAAYSWDTIADQTIEVYRSVLGRVAKAG